MSGFSTFAILGASGKLGSQILHAFLDHPAAASLSLRVLTRPGSSPRSRNLPSSVTFWPIDYSDPIRAEAQLASALSGVEVVISAVGSGLPSSEDARIYAENGKHIGDLPGFKSQRLVALAAKKAGCQLFVPAEYGSVTHLLTSDNESFVRGKKFFQESLRKINLPWLLLYAGMFPPREPGRTPLPPNTSALPAPPYATARAHLAQFLAHLLLDFPQERLEWGIYMIRGYRREMLVEGQWVITNSL